MNACASRNARLGFHLACVLSTLGLPLAPLAASVAAADPGATTPADVPVGWWAAVQKDLQAREYQVSVQPRASCAPESHTAASIYQAPNRAHGLRTCFGGDGVHVVPRSAGSPAGETPAWRWGLKLLGYGDANALTTPAAAAPVAKGNRVEYARGALTEWYVNDARGLEQGFTLHAPVGRSNATTLRIGFPGNLHPTAQDTTIEFLSAGGVRVLAFGKLEAWDATGRALPASMTLVGAALDLTVDTRGARYPITVDPLATSAAWTAESNQVGAFFGSPVATAGDVNGDGYSDVVVGAQQYDNGQSEEGAVFVYLGGASGLGLAAAWTAESNQAAAFFGSSVATAGDVNGDGYSDVIVGAHAYDNGQDFEGRAYVYLGGASGLGLAAAWTAESDQADAHFGYKVAAAGDVNGDGYGDVIVGAHEYGIGGRAFVYLGGASGLALTAAWTADSDQGSAMFGRSVATAGDVNGDGYDDVIVGASAYNNGQSSEGRAFVYLGGASGLALTAAWTAESDQALGFFGISVATAGDVNGDGYSDAIVGASGYDNGQTEEGRAYVFLGGASGLALTAAWTAESDQATAYFGLSAATAGDVNGDGYSDVIVGAIGYGNGESAEGRAFVYLGGASGPGLVAAWTAESDQADAYFGHSVATAGDVNGDGYSDVIVGAYSYNNGQNDEGRAYVYLGGADGIRSGNPTTAGAKLESDQAGALLGFSVASAGDVNGDGYADVIIGAFDFDSGQTDEGAAFVFHGSATGITTGSVTSAVAKLESDQVDAGFGHSVASAGDVNGDGYSDVIVGAFGYDAGDTDEGAAFVFLGSATGIASATAATLGVARLESNQANANLGVEVASAGDVNADGYSDVIVGAHAYDAGQADEGAAFVFLGSASGIASAGAGAAAARLESDQAGANLGAGVSGAGDVNGDGYSDVIVGAPNYASGQTGEGAAFVFLGSASGIAGAGAGAAAAQLESDQAGAGLGHCAAAGDVNADGYADVIVGASGYHAGLEDEGAAFVFLGSALGIDDGNPGTAAAQLESNQAAAELGISVAGAGDVNGDGYADVIVGARSYDAPDADEGAAFVFLGSAAGIVDGNPGTAAAQLESNLAGAHLGVSVSGIGDVNGDGFADVIVGSHGYDAGQTDEGAAFVFYGGGGQSGRPVLARQLRGGGGGQPVQPWGGSYDVDGFDVSANATDPRGRGRVKLQVQSCPVGVPFGHGSCASATSPSWTDVTATSAGVTLTRSLSGLANGTLRRWRARVLHAPYSVTQPGITAPPNPAHGPWRRLFGQAIEADVRISRHLSFAWVTVGNPGNGCETQSQGCFGAVADAYQISRYEVTNAQYAEFLNAVAATDTNALYHSSMNDNAIGGITQNGSSGSFSYGVKSGFASKPVNFVSFYDSLRFANWLQNGQPSGAQGNGTTEDGAYTITSGGITANSIARNGGATIFLTSENEWYKAAYYNAAGSSYFAYPAGTSTTTVCAAPGATANTANCDNVVSGGALTNAGAYTGAASPYGTFDQGGNIGEWNEAIVSGSSRAWRGGSYGNTQFTLAAASRGNYDPTLHSVGIGFRIARLLDTDDDGTPDATDTDDDNDGLLDVYETDTGSYVSPTDTGSDPLDSDSDDDGLLDGAEVALGTNPNDPDHDDDGDLDGADNCPFIVNANQTNSDALPAGNACQCGDVNNDGVVNAADVTRASESLVGATLGGAFDLDRCNVVGPNSGPTVCDVGDLAVLERFAQGQAVTVQNACQAYLTP